MPSRFARALVGHEVRSVTEMGWGGRQNGELLRLAEREFDVFLTVDRNLSFQQDVNQFQIAVIVLIATSNQLRALEPMVKDVLAVCPYVMPGQVVKVGGVD